MKIIIPGRPITKKNNMNITCNRRTLKPIVRQSKQYNTYETASLWYLKKYREKTDSKQLHMKAIYYMPNKKSWPDLIGLLQATSDILEKAGIIKNDKYIISYDGSRIAGVDKDNPRVEVEITEKG